ncbi:MAG TPA: succinate dehydrogenase cytochrome b subunit [Sorangium sp.]|nr:succinate dehydrogenase cytochrome b subunit [Sorangium sp.]
MASRTLTMADTTIGKKMVMAVTGVVLFGFVIGHMIGNLQIFMGPTTMNEYGKFLHDNKTLLWGTRGVLLISLIAHVVSAVQLAARNRSARPIPYKKKTNVVTSYAARTMVWSGPILALYIAYHLAHLTVGVSAGLGYEHLLPHDGNGLPNVYNNVVSSFQVWWCAAIYIVAQLALGLHLYHGSWSLLQSLGLSHERYNNTVRSAASAVALAVTAGFLSVPISIFFGFVK